MTGGIFNTPPTKSRTDVDGNGANGIDLFGDDGAAPPADDVPTQPFANPGTSRASASQGHAGNSLADVNSSVEAVHTCKLPPFWKAHPEMWFTQIESAFVSSRVRQDESKYHLLIAALSPEILADIFDIVKTAPARGKYEYMKNQILARFADSAERQLQKLFNELELGDKKPSQLLRQMRALAGNLLSEEAIRIKWLALLPVTAQRALKVLRNTVVDELANVADLLLEVPAAPSVFEASPAQQPMCPAVVPASGPAVAAVNNQSASMASELAAIRIGISQLTREMLERLPNAHGAPPRARFSRSPSPARQKPYCHFHWKFGASARKCVEPCDFKNNPQPPKGAGN